MAGKKLHRVFALIIPNEKSAPESKAGIVRYAELHPDWALQCSYATRMPTPGEIRTMAKEAGTGFIVTGATPEKTFRALCDTRRPIVQIDSLDPSATRPGLCNISIDNNAIATAAAHHFLSRLHGRSFAFVTPNTARTFSNDFADFAVARFECFRSILRKHELGCQLITVGNEEAMLSALTKPIAVFAANDARAAEILFFARKLRLRVPEDLAILGVDNDTAICEHTRPTLSSIEVDFFGEAYRACEILDLMLSGKDVPSQIIHPSSPHVIARRSSARPGISGVVVSRAMELIERKATLGITVNDVAMELGISRPLLDLRFREMGETSANEAIQVRKFREVQLLLRTTNMTLKAISESCGFHNLSYMMTAFKSRFGMCPTAYRNEPLTSSCTR